MLINGYTLNIFSDNFFIDHYSTVVSIKAIKYIKAHFKTRGAASIALRLSKEVETVERIARNLGLTTKVKPTYHYLYICYFKKLGVFKVGHTNNWNTRRGAFNYYIEGSLRQGYEAPKLLSLLRFHDKETVIDLEKNLKNFILPYRIKERIFVAGNTEVYKFG